MKRSRSALFAATAIAALVAGVTTSASAQQRVSEAEAENKLVEINQALLRLPLGTFIVEGERVLNQPVLAVERIVFRPGARLMFSQEARAQRREFVVVAREIVSEDAAKAGEIGWAPRLLNTVSGVGSGVAGSSATGEGQVGGAGGAGPRGTDGTDGADAPSLSLLVERMQGSLRVGLRGQDAAWGGKGGTGGQGGTGGHGTPASQSFFDCKRGAGDGAPGGRGGDGGQGGNGGIGGDGGTLTLIAAPDVLPLVTRVIVADLSGGQGGRGGEPGDPGPAGVGGPGAQEALPHCRGNGARGGSLGPGGPGRPGQNSRAGNAGTFFVGAVDGDTVGRFFR